MQIALQHIQYVNSSSGTHFWENTVFSARETISQNRLYEPST